MSWKPIKSCPKNVPVILAGPFLFGGEEIATYACIGEKISGNLFLEHSESPEELWEPRWWKPLKKCPGKRWAKIKDYDRARKQHGN